MWNPNETQASFFGSRMRRAFVLEQLAHLLEPREILLPHLRVAEPQLLQVANDDVGHGHAHVRLAVSRDYVPGRPWARGRADGGFVGFHVRVVMPVLHDIT